MSIVRWPRPLKCCKVLPSRYETHWLAVFRAKLGLPDGTAADRDRALINDFLELLQQQKVDFTLAFRALLPAAKGDEAPLSALFGPAAPMLQGWLDRWRTSLPTVDTGHTEGMRIANPAYIARNHQVEAALQAAVESNDYLPFERLLKVLRAPFDERADDVEYSLPAPAEQTAVYQTFCGT